MEEKQIVNVHSGAIHIENKVNLVSRQAWFYLVYRALPTIKNEDQFIIPLSDLKEAIGYNSKNDEHLKQAIRDLAETTIEWNIFNKNKVSWEINVLLAGFKIDKGFCHFSFSPFLREKLKDPEMYIKLDLYLSKKFKSKHSLALYTLALDYIYLKDNYGEKNFTLEEIRRFLGLKDSEYLRVVDLNKEIIKKAVKEINETSDINLVITPIRTYKQRITGFKMQMQIKKNQLDFYKNYKSKLKQTNQLNIFDNLDKPKMLEVKEPEPKNLIKITNEKLMAFYAENNISMTTQTVQNKLVELKETFQDRFENYLLFLMNYTNREDKRITIKSLSAFYIGLIKNDSQMENYFLYHQKQHEQEKEKLSKLNDLLELELKNQYNKHLANDFENYIIQNVNRLENKIIDILKSKLKPGDFFYDVIIQKTYSGIVDKTLITKAKESVRMMTISYLRDHLKELKYKPISFEDWKDEEISEKDIQELKENLLKTL